MCMYYFHTKWSPWQWAFWLSWTILLKEKKKEFECRPLLPFYLLWPITLFLCAQITIHTQELSHSGFCPCVPIWLRDLTHSPAASVSTTQTCPPPTSLQRLKPVATPVMEKLSLRPRRVFPTDRIHHDIMGFLLRNLKPGGTEWPIGLQALSRKAYYEIKYNRISQTYELGPRMVSIMYLVMFAECRSLTLCVQKCWHCSCW